MINVDLEQYDENIDKKLDKVILKEDDIIADISEEHDNTRKVLQEGINSDSTRPLNALLLERTLVERYSEDSLIWALTQVGIGNCLNQLYQLESEELHNCQKIIDIFNSDTALIACSKREEIIELLYLYPYLDFKERIQALIPFKDCVKQGIVMRIYRVGDKTKINMTEYGDVEFQLVSKSYDSLDSSCWITVNTLFDFKQTNTKWTWFAHSNKELVNFVRDIQNKITDSTIKNNLVLVNRFYVKVHVDYHTQSRSTLISEKIWIPNGTQLGLGNEFLGFENKVFDYYKNEANESKKNKELFYGRTGDGVLDETYFWSLSVSNIQNRNSTNKFNLNQETTLGIPIGITIKG